MLNLSLFRSLVLPMTSSLLTFHVPKKGWEAFVISSTSTVFPLTVPSLRSYLELLGTSSAPLSTLYNIVPILGVAIAIGSTINLISTLCTPPQCGCRAKSSSAELPANRRKMGIVQAGTRWMDFPSTFSVSTPAIFATIISIIDNTVLKWTGHLLNSYSNLIDPFALLSIAMAFHAFTGIASLARSKAKFHIATVYHCSFIPHQLPMGGNVEGAGKALRNLIVSGWSSLSGWYSGGRGEGEGGPSEDDDSKRLDDPSEDNDGKSCCFCGSAGHPHPHKHDGQTPTDECYCCREGHPAPHDSRVEVCLLRANAAN